MTKEKVIYESDHSNNAVNMELDKLYLLGKAAAYDEALEVIKKLNKLNKPKQKWIPCNERLPEESNFYEVTVDFGSGPVTDTTYYNTQIGKWCTTNYIMAWRERLSEPYKVSEQE